MNKTNWFTALNLQFRFDVTVVVLSYLNHYLSICFPLLQRFQAHRQFFEFVCPPKHNWH